MSRKQLPYAISRDVTRRVVEVIYNTNRTQSWGTHEPIIERIEISRLNETDRELTYRLKRSADDSLANWQSRDNAVRYVTEDGLAAGEKALMDTIAEHDRITRRGHRTWQYKFIAAVAKQLQWPKFYSTDLTHWDAYQLATTNPQAFLWAVRECGTYLIPLSCNTPEYRSSITSYASDNRYFYVDANGARELTMDEFLRVKL